MYAANVTPAWVGEAVGSPKVWPVVIKHQNGFEPGILHEIGGAIWRNEVRYRMSLADATNWARLLVASIK